MHDGRVQYGASFECGAMFEKNLDLGIKAIGGVRVKKSMSGSFERSPLGGTEAFYRMSKLICVQKLSHFEVRKISRICYKKGCENWIFGCFTYFWTTFAFGVQSSWNLEHSFYTWRQKIWSIFFEKCCQLLILCQFYTKKSWKMMIFCVFLAFFRVKFA